MKKNNSEKQIIIESEKEENIAIKDMIKNNALEDLPKPTDIISLKNNTKIIIKHKSSQISENFYNKLKEKSLPNLKISMNTIKNNKLILFNIPKEITDEEILKEVKNEEELKYSEIDIIKSFNTQPESRHVVIAVDNFTNQQLLKKGRILIDYNSIRIQKYINIKRCYKCQSFGHYANNCKRKEVCGKCTGSHDTRLCTATTTKCANCGEDHPSFSVLCKQYKLYKQKVLYGNV